MAKNPFMSAWLSAANKAGNTARGHASAATNANAKRAQKDVMNAWMSMWFPGSKSSGSKSSGTRRTASSTPARRKKR